mgnify:CR=1 FL=1
MPSLRFNVNSSSSVKKRLVEGGGYLRTEVSAYLLRIRGLTGWSVEAVWMATGSSLRWGLVSLQFLIW